MKIWSRHIAQNTKERIWKILPCILRQGLGQNFSKNFVHILGNATTSYFHFEIFWPSVVYQNVENMHQFLSDFFYKLLEFFFFMHIMTNIAYSVIRISIWKFKIIKHFPLTDLWPLLISLIVRLFFLWLWPECQWFSDENTRFSFMYLTQVAGEVVGSFIQG